MVSVGYSATTVTRSTSLSVPATGTPFPSLGSAGPRGHAIG